MKVKWPMSSNDGPRELSEMLKRTLTAQFQLPRQKAAQLRSVEQGGRQVGRRVQFVRIFDPNVLKAAVGRFDDLDHQRPAVLFEGYMSGGDAFLYSLDQRLGQ